MPTVFKSTMIFEGRAHGWSETWWQERTSNSYFAAMVQLESLAIARAALLADPCRIIGLRVSIEGIAYDAYSVGANLTGPTQSSADEPDAAILLRGRDLAAKRFKNCYLRGHPDVVDERFGVYVPAAAPGFPAAMAAYRDTLAGVASVWGWWGTVNTGRAWRLITGIAQVPNTDLITITTFGNLVPPELVGRTTVVRGSGINKPGKSILNSQMVVTVVGVNQFTTTTPYGILPWLGNGRLNWNDHEFIKLGSVSDLRIVTRRVGAPLLSSRGHARRRAKG